MWFFELPKKKVLLSFIISPYLFVWQSLQRHEFPPKSFSHTAWMRNIGEMYKIIDTSCASPPSLWAALQCEDSCCEFQLRMYSLYRNLTFPPLQLHLCDTLLSMFYFTFIMLLLVVYESIFLLQRLFSIFNSCNSPFRLSFSFWNRKQENKFQIKKFRWDDFVGLLKLKQNKTRPTRFFT